MKTKILLGLVISAITLLSFSFSEITKSASVKEKAIINSSIINPSAKEPIGGLIIEDDF